MRREETSALYSTPARTRIFDSHYLRGMGSGGSETREFQLLLREWEEAFIEQGGGGGRGECGRVVCRPPSGTIYDITRPNLLSMKRIAFQRNQ